jgi:hypothetical protein
LPNEKASPKASAENRETSYLLHLCSQPNAHDALFLAQQYQRIY